MYEQPIGPHSANKRLCHGEYLMGGSSYVQWPCIPPTTRFSYRQTARATCMGTLHLSAHEVQYSGCCALNQCQQCRHPHIHMHDLPCSQDFRPAILLHACELRTAIATNTCIAINKNCCLVLSICDSDHAAAHLASVCVIRCKPLLRGVALWAPVVVLHLRKGCSQRVYIASVNADLRG